MNANQVHVALSFIKFLAVFGAVASVTVHPVQALPDILWDNGTVDNAGAAGGDNAWLIADNWVGDVLPTTGIAGAGQTPVINLDGTNRAIYSTGDNMYDSFRVGSGAATSGRLDIIGGILRTDTTEAHRIGVAGGTGVIDQSGGSLLTGSALFELGLDTNSTGTYNQTGGTAVFGRESSGTSLVIGSNAGTGFYSISGTGSILRTRAGVELGRTGGSGTGVGTFTIQGTAATQIGIGSEGSVDGRWIQNAGSTLSLSIDGATVGGVTHLFVDEVGNNGGGDVTFALNSILDLGFFQNQQAGSWDVMSWEGTLTDSGLALAAGDAVAGWSFQFVDTGGGVGLDTLRVSFVPEPSSFAMLAGGVWLLGSIRCRQLT